MTEHSGLRARKKERTRQAISDTAVSLFLTHGFDQVAVADIAAAAEVSKPTLFRYFRTKEHLVLHRFADHQGEAARVVRARDPHQRPLAALHAHFRVGLERRDPVTGLCDSPDVLAFHRLVFTTPSLASRLADHTAADAAALADALRDIGTHPATDLVPRLVAAQIIAVQHALARANWTALTEGHSADDTYPLAVANADTAFDLLADGAARHGY